MLSKSASLCLSTEIALPKRSSLLPRRSCRLRTQGVVRGSRWLSWELPSVDWQLLLRWHFILFPADTVHATEDVREGRLFAGFAMPVCAWGHFLQAREPAMLRVAVQFILWLHGTSRMDGSIPLLWAGRLARPARPDGNTACGSLPCWPSALLQGPLVSRSAAFEVVSALLE